MTYGLVLSDDQCQCFDSVCHRPEVGQCKDKATQTLWRIDMSDVFGTRFCAECAEDAMQSGLLTDYAERPYRR